MRHTASGHLVDPVADAALLDFLTGPAPPKAKSNLPRRDEALDPLMLAAALASGPHVTRNHYHHDFFPGVMLPQAEGAWDWTKWRGDDCPLKEQQRFTYVSQQGPRRLKLQSSSEKENHPVDLLKSTANAPASQRPRLESSLPSPSPDVPPSLTVEVKCMARTRIPTPHGHVFLHLYHNNKDDKEHLAIVVDPAQLSVSDSGRSLTQPIRSHSLDAVWSESETEMDRITRGAYLGRLTPTSHHASTPPAPTSSTTRAAALPSDVLPPLVRIHSECFTGETVGSMRCDCGEQLDEALRLISEPVNLPSPARTTMTMPGRGAVIYLRQEGRGIGLLSKLRAYNLQDLGHDTVTANLMLGHQADERGYETAAAILRDLGLEGGVRVLTNNPDKIHALEKEGIRIRQRIPMVPRSWQHRRQQQQQQGPTKRVAVPRPLLPTAKLELPSMMEEGNEMYGMGVGEVVGATLIGGAVHGEELDKYLRTKIVRMGHMLPLWLDEEGIVLA
jgi:GTP cyclohydrolase II